LIIRIKSSGPLIAPGVAGGEVGVAVSVGMAEGVVNGGFVSEHPFIKIKMGIKKQKSFFVRAEFILSS
jgi:hypothetical protein